MGEHPGGRKTLEWVGEGAWTLGWGGMRVRGRMRRKGSGAGEPESEGRRMATIVGRQLL